VHVADVTISPFPLSSSFWPSVPGWIVAAAAAGGATPHR